MALSLAVDNKPIQTTNHWQVSVHELGRIGHIHLSYDLIRRMYEGQFPEREIISLEYTGITKNRYANFSVVYRAHHEQ